MFENEGGRRKKEKIGKRRPGNMARPCQYWHGPCQPSGNGGFGLA